MTRQTGTGTTQVVTNIGDPLVDIIERIVMNPDVDLDKLERMLVMKERMDAQRAKSAFAQALSDAKAMIAPIIKDTTVDYSTNRGRTRYNHETLAGIAKAIDPALSTYGLSYRFKTSQENGYVYVTCIVSHRDGHSEQTTLSGAPDQTGSKNGFQAVGSAVTYLQRYTLKALLGLAAGDDDDARTAAPAPDTSTREEPGFDAGKTTRDIEAQIKDAATLDDLKRVWTRAKKALLRLNTEYPDLFAVLEAAKADAKVKLLGQKKKDTPAESSPPEDSFAPAPKNRSEPKAAAEIDSVEDLSDEIDDLINGMRDNEQ